MELCSYNQNIFRIKKSSLICNQIKITSNISVKNWQIGNQVMSGLISTYQYFVSQKNNKFQSTSVDLLLWQLSKLAAIR